MNDTLADMREYNKTQVRTFKQLIGHMHFDTGEADLAGKTKEHRILDYNEHTGLFDQDTVS